MTVGNIKKVMNKDITTPTLIIQPKFITGKILETIKEAKPAIVVRTVYKQGLEIKSTVSTNNFLTGLGLTITNSL